MSTNPQNTEERKRKQINTAWLLAGDFDNAGYVVPAFMWFFGGVPLFLALVFGLSDDPVDAIYQGIMIASGVVLISAGILTWQLISLRRTIAAAFWLKSKSDQAKKRRAESQSQSQA